MRTASIVCARIELGKQTQARANCECASRLLPASQSSISTDLIDSTGDHNSASNVGGGGAALALSPGGRPARRRPRHPIRPAAPEMGDLMAAKRRPLPQLWTLFEQTDGVTWQRARTMSVGATGVGLVVGAYEKEKAVRIFQNRLLAPYLDGGPRAELRPVGHVISYSYLRERREEVYPAYRQIREMGAN